MLAPSQGAMCWPGSSPRRSSSRISSSSALESQHVAAGLGSFGSSGLLRRLDLRSAQLVGIATPMARRKPVRHCASLAALPEKGKSQQRKRRFGEVEGQKPATAVVLVACSDGCGKYIILALSNTPYKA